MVNYTIMVKSYKHKLCGAYYLFIKVFDVLDNRFFLNNFFKLNI